MPTVHPELPSGPFVVSRPDQAGDLLIFVPRSVESHLIDHATGGYGYSHVAVDCGEIEILTGRRVMIESTVNSLVSRVLLNKYGKRPYIRVRLARTGTPIRDFCACVISRLGEPYDNLEALTWGRVDNPAKQICSSLATDCLPDDIRLDIATSIHRRDKSQKAVSLQPGIVPPRVFISPNALARFFGAEPGYKIDRPGVLVRPNRLRRQRRFPIQVPTWGVGLAIGTASICAGLLAVALRRMSKRAIGPITPEKSGIRKYVNPK